MKDFIDLMRAEGGSDEEEDAIVAMVEQEREYIARFVEHQLDYTLTGAKAKELIRRIRDGDYPS